MYIPPAFRVEDFGKLAKFIDENSFAILITQSDGAPFASHLPLLLDREGGAPGRLLGHIARANPQWRHFAGGTESLAVFHGAHGYISPSFYATEPAVPTWNYLAVHAYGIPKIIEDDTLLNQVMERTVQKYESGREQPWQNQLPEDYRRMMMKSIVGFEVSITRLEGKFKLGQNRSRADLNGVYAALSQSTSPEDRRVAEIMKEEALVG